MTPTCLSIAGSDPSGGAGIQADIKTISALGCYAAAAITAITVQNTMGVQAVHPCPPDVVAAQVTAVLTDLETHAVKVGMAGSSDNIRAIADTLRHHPVPFVVTDPVLFASSGHPLCDAGGVEAFLTHLFPVSTLVTPNLYELFALTGIEDIDRAAADLLRRGGCKAILVKGGHREGVPTDSLYTLDAGRRDFHAKRIDTRADHGTGCTLSSAIAANVALGHPLHHAILMAKGFVTKALKAGATMYIGQGRGPMNHFFKPRALRVEEIM